jgi:hypothetical protein
VRKIAAAVLVLPFTACVVWAQQQRPNSLGQLKQQDEQAAHKMQKQEQRTQSANIATKAEPMSHSLEQLLTDGWTITSSSMGPNGTQFILYMQQQRSWAMCELLAVDKHGNFEDQPISRCVALN